MGWKKKALHGQLISIPEARAKAMKEFVKHSTKKDLQSFLGSIGSIKYYRRFVPNISENTARLTPATSKSAPSRLQWTKDMEAAHLCLVNVYLLNVPTIADVFTLHTDASGLGVGRVLSVTRAGKEEPVGYYARKLKGVDIIYSAIEVEVLAVVEPIRHFATYLYG